METLSNSILTVQIAEHGAELQSIKKDGKARWETINTVMPETLMK